MKQNNTTQSSPSNTPAQICKHCGEEYTVLERNRVYGVNSLMTGYCSAGCYTQGAIMKEAPIAFTPTPIQEGGWTKLFLDNGDFLRTGDTSEIFIRTSIEGESFDICGFSCNETDKANAYAARIVECWNNYDAHKTNWEIALRMYDIAKTENEKLKSENEQLREALTLLTRTFESICKLYAEDPINWENYNNAKSTIQKHK